MIKRRKMSKLILSNQTTPSTPEAGTTAVYVDTATKALKSINDDGVSITYTLVPAFWTEITGYTATPASTSTLTTTSDYTTVILTGTAMKYTIGSITYYGIVTTTSSNLLTFAGAPLNNNVTALYYDASGTKAFSIVLTVPNTYEDASNSALMTSDNKCPILWAQPKAYAVRYSVWSRLHDTGATPGQVSIRINNTEVNTTAGGLSIAADATEYPTVVDIAVDAYDINYGEALEVTAVKGSTGDAADLRVTVTMVRP
jgi:hypothetical protein